MEAGMEDRANRARQSAMARFVRHALLIRVPAKAGTQFKQPIVRDTTLRLLLSQEHEVHSGARFAALGSFDGAPLAADGLPSVRLPPAAGAMGLPPAAVAAV